MLGEWAYARLYATSDQRARTLPAQPLQLQRPHGSLSHRPPGSRLNNVDRNYLRHGGLNSREAQTEKLSCSRSNELGRVLGITPGSLHMKSTRSGLTRLERLSERRRAGVHASARCPRRGG
jgi:hypothetical protein